MTDEDILDALRRGATLTRWEGGDKCALHSGCGRMRWLIPRFQVHGLLMRGLVVIKSSSLWATEYGLPAVERKDG